MIQNSGIEKILDDSRRAIAGSSTRKVGGRQITLHRLSHSAQTRNLVVGEWQSTGTAAHGLGRSGIKNLALQDLLPVARIDYW
jgi:hypothetical protein